ncbi:MAG: tryptophan--tRNA ligase, partial [bacterium]|nr:tryptophan--tRNA ligase [bacterium]
IYLSDDAQTVEKKISSAITDENRKRREDPGNPEVCVLFDYHKLHSPKETVQKVDQECRHAKIGCVEDKKLIAKTLNLFLDPIRKRREEFMKNSSLLDEILEEGAQKASRLAEITLGKVRKAMHV